MLSSTNDDQNISDITKRLKILEETLNKVQQLEHVNTVSFFFFIFIYLILF